MTTLQNYRQKFLMRYDEDGAVHYFQTKDFPSLTRRDISFPSERGEILRGGVYGYPNAENLIVFAHGIGPGHRAYMREIERLCRSGYFVLAYDMAGCGESDGEELFALSQAISDLNACLDFVKKNFSCPVSLVGHSLGGYAVGNIGNFRKDFDKIVCLSGFLSVERIAKMYFGEAADILAYERAQTAYADSCSLTAYRGKKALLIHSTDDAVVPYEETTALVQKEYPELSYCIVQGRKHNPNYTADAVSYMNEVFSAYARAAKAGELSSLEEKKAFLAGTDWLRMTEQDEEVFSRIEEFLKS